MTRRDRLPLLDEAALAVEVKATTAESDKKSAAASHDAELSRVRVERGVVVPGDEETPGRTGGTSDGDSLTTKQTVAPDHTGGSGGFDGLAANADLDFVLGTAALDYARRGWEVHPLRRGDKIPATPHGVLDATSDIGQVLDWWSGRHAGANIGGRVPEGVLVVDTDPRNGGEESLARLVTQHGRLPETLTHYSGRGDGGRHLFFRRPPGKLTAKRLGPGIDLKTHSGYVVLPPSTHPATGKPYTRVGGPVAPLPDWFVGLLRPAARPERTARSRTGWTVKCAGAHSVAEWYRGTATWSEILEPHGWQCVYEGDPDDDEGAQWRHPAATAAMSATVRHGCLFVYSTSTDFEVTTAGEPHGYTKFRAYAVLNTDGDLRVAAKKLRKKRSREAGRST